MTLWTVSSVTEDTVELRLSRRPFRSARGLNDPFSISRALRHPHCTPIPVPCSTKYHFLSVYFPTSLQCRFSFECLPLSQFVKHVTLAFILKARGRRGGGQVPFVPSQEINVILFFCILFVNFNVYYSNTTEVMPSEGSGGQL